MSAVDSDASTGSRGRWSLLATLGSNVLALGVVSLFTDFSSEMMNPLLPIFVAGLVPLGWAPVVVGLTEGIAETTASLLKLISGRLSDRLGKRKIIAVGGYGLSTVARPLMALVPASAGPLSSAVVVLVKFLDRIGKGLRTAPRDALIGDSVVATHRGLAFSFHRAMDHVGAVLGPLLAIVILYLFLGYGLWRGGTTKPNALEMHALRWLFATALLPGLLAMVVLVASVREVVAPHAPTSARAESVWRKLPRRFYAFVAVVVLFALGNSSDMFLLLLAWERFKLGLLSIIGLWIALHLSKIAFSLPGGVLSDRWGRAPLILVGWLLYACVYLGFAFADQQWQIWALLVAYGSYYGLTEGTEKALVTDLVPSAQRGTAFGIYHGAIGLAALPASLLFGVFWSVLGPRRAFSIGAALAALAALLLGPVLSTRQKDAR